MASDLVIEVASAPDLMAAALDYVARGWPVFPCDPRSKRPLTRRGFKDATTDHATVVGWWQRWPDAMIGMPTGDPSGCWVLDVDDPEAFAANTLSLPLTRKAMTGKGFHLYFAHDVAQPVRNAQRHPKKGWPFPGLPGAEVRGEGGYVILPPSRHPSGRLYSWAEDCEAAPAPAELMRIVTKTADKPAAVHTATHVRQGGHDTPYGLAALQSECDAIGWACNGEQEGALNVAALKIGSLVAGGELTLNTARARLIAAGLALPSFNAHDLWTVEAIVAKIERSLADGAASPRSAPFFEYRAAAFADREDAFRYDQATGEILPSPGSAGIDEDSDIETLNWSALAPVMPTSKRFIIDKLAPAGEVTLFTGGGSTGKSLLAQQLATGIAASVSTLGLDLRQASAIYLTCEDDAAQLHWRQARICAALGVPMQSLAGNLWTASLRGRLDNALGKFNGQGGFKLARAYERLADLIRRTNATFVALDNVAHLFTGSEINRGEVTQFVNALNRLAGETGAAILLIAHPNKAGDSYSGSTAWLNAVRSQIFLEHDQSSDLRTLTVAKANYAAKGEALRFAWVDWAFVLESDLSPDMAKALAETAKANGENEAFMRCLNACTERKRNVSHVNGSNYAPRIFAGMPEAKGVKAKDFAAAMERVLSTGKIRLDAELWPGSDRHKKRGINTKSH